MNRIIALIIICIGISPAAGSEHSISGYSTSATVNNIVTTETYQIEGNIGLPEQFQVTSSNYLLEGYFVAVNTADAEDDRLIESFSKEATELPVTYFLSQNYPNPFNAQTTISFALPEASHARVEIYDLLGRSVGIPVDQFLQAGYHSLTWDAADQSSGMYFYKIQAGEFTETKKMLLLK